MNRWFKFFLISIVFVCFSLFVVIYLHSPNAEAADLRPLYLAFERMQVNQSTDMVLMFTPSVNFTAGGELKISFLNDIESWCANPVNMVVAGIDSSPIDEGVWQIELPLPENPGFSFEAECIPGNLIAGTYDTISIGNIGELNSGVNYGLLVLKNSGFKTSSMTGNKRIFVEMDDGVNSEHTELSITLIPSDTLTVLARVVNISTITCSVSNSSLSFSTLSKNGGYVTLQHSVTATTSLTSGYYWAVFGQGDGTTAGLWKSTAPTSLIPSTGSTKINLLTNHGFGLVVSSPTGTVVSDFVNTSPGIFGAINSGFGQSRLIFYEKNPGTSPATAIMTIGARAGVATEAGGYSENLTYLCGGFY